jgi:hypothetical protein
MRNYGLPASYYTKDTTGKQVGFEKFLAGDVSPVELENRIITAQDRVLKSNPELMKQFQAAAAKEYIMGNNSPQISKQSRGNGMMNSGSSGNSNGGGGGGASSGLGLFNMVSNLFSNLGDTVSSAPVENYRRDKPTQDIDSIINNVHNKISTNQDINNIETLSVSDEEITSIIEDTADIKILRTNKKNKNSRTLNL